MPLVPHTRSAVAARRGRGFLRALHLVVPLWLVGFSPVATNALSILVTIDTAPIAGVSGFLAFDFVDGDLAQNNTVIVDAFATDGTIGALSLTGSASGDLATTPLVLTDATFFNEGLLPMLFGTTISFSVDLSEVGGNPAPDEFSFFILDGGLTPLATSDPTGASALISVDLFASGAVGQVFQAGGATATVIVPEPALALLFGVALSGLGARRRH